MRLQTLVNPAVQPHRVSLSGGGPGQAAPSGPMPATTSAFITPQTLVSFPVASLVVRLLWAVADKLVAGAGQNNWVGLGIALIVGLLVYTLSVSDNKLAMTGTQKRLGVVVAILNAFVLFAAAAGIGEVVGSEEAQS